MGLVYVIEDEPSLRNGLVEALGRLPGVQAHGLALVQDGVDLLEGYPPSLIVTELNLPERCGLDMLAELDARGMDVPMVLISGCLEAYREYIPERAGLVALAKPFDFNVLLQHVQHVLAPPLAVEEPIDAALGIGEYLKLSCLGDHTVEILVFSDNASEDLIGRLVVLGGQLWSAQDSHGMGADAFLRLACIPIGGVACNGLERTSLMRNVYTEWDALIARAASLRDGSTANPQFGLNQDQPTFQFDPPGAFTPPQPLKCAPQDDGPGPLVMQPMEGNTHTLAGGPQPTLEDYLAGANAAEMAGANAEALAHLERAMVIYPGHPEILLWALRLRG
ncbi:MAG: response regulator [bacterium]|nr:response regulator [bacterium]